MKGLEKIRENAIFQGVLTLGVFATAFYFLFLRGNSAYSQQSQKNPEDIQDGREVFYSQDGDPNNYIRGFRAPESIDDIIFDRGFVSIITKPDTSLFGGLPQKGGVRVSREECCLVYDGYVNGEKVRNKERYNDIKDKIVLTNRAQIRN